MDSITKKQNLIKVDSSNKSHADTNSVTITSNIISNSIDKLASTISESSENPKNSGSWFKDKLLPLLISTLTAILIFVLTTLKDKNKEKTKKENEENDKVSYLRLLLNSVIEIVEGQSTIFKEYLKEIKPTDTNFKSIDKGVITDLKRANELFGDADYFVAFNNRYNNITKPVETFSRLKYLIDYLNIVFPHLDQYLVDLEKESDSRLTAFQESTNKTHSIAKGLSLRAIKDQDPFLQGIQSIYLNFSKGNKDITDKQYYFDNLVKPIYDFMFSFIKANDLQTSTLKTEILELEVISRQAYEQFVSGSLTAVNTRLIEEIKTFDFDKIATELRTINEQLK